MYYWPGIHKDVVRYVTSCTSCQLNKPWNQTGKGPLQPIGIPDLPFSEVGLDFVGPLPTSKNGNNYLLTVVDYKTRISRFIPCKSDPTDERKKLSATATAVLYFKHIFRHHGLPAILRTDRGPQFVGDFFRAVFKLCGTRQKFGAAYHPQSQGLTEHANKTGIKALPPCTKWTISLRKNPARTKANILSNTSSGTWATVQNTTTGVSTPGSRISLLAPKPSVSGGNATPPSPPTPSTIAPLVIVTVLRRKYHFSPVKVIGGACGVARYACVTD